MIARMKSAFLLALCLITAPTLAASLSDIKVENGDSQATVTLSFAGQPVYDYFPLCNPDRVVLDIRQSGVIQGLPLNFSGENVVKRIRTSTPKDKQSIRLVLELTQSAKTRAVTQRSGSSYNVVFKIRGRQPVTRAAPVSTAAPAPSRTAAKSRNARKMTVVNNTNATTRPGNAVPTSNDMVIVAIDAGHGGQDPGATGQRGLHEKNVTIAIACKLKVLLNNDPMFKGVLTRDGDYFISVMGRSEVARKENANLLVSIHADSAPSHSATGASVWVLSNRRANSEMANWLEQREKQSELLGGAGDLLANSQADPYLSQAVLDLQFGHSQRVGYDVAAKVLKQLRGVSPLHKRLPEHASLGVLRSPDIPSLLVETGFISNTSEEQLLGGSAYQNKIAMAIYKGLRNYFLAHPLQSLPKEENRPLGSSPTVSVASNPATGVTQYTGVVQRHKVVRGDSLTVIAAHYGVSPQAIIQANNMKSSNVMLGQTLKIPAS